MRCYPKAWCSCVLPRQLDQTQVSHSEERRDGVVVHAPYVGREANRRDLIIPTPAREAYTHDSTASARKERDRNEPTPHEK